MRTPAWLIRLPLLTSLFVAGCHHAQKTGDDFDFAVDDDAGVNSDGGNVNGDGPPLPGDADLGQGTLDVEPSTLQTITVTAGAMTPTVAFSATWSGAPVTAAWTVDRGDIVTLPAATSAMTTLAPRGTTGGLVTLIAGVNGQTVKRQVLVKLAATQNGGNTTTESSQIPTTPSQLTAGGGVGGVGGEGLGGGTDPTTTTLLGTPTSNGATQNLKMLYPYDGTVWPRGMLAPLLQWDWSFGDADAIRIDLSTTTGSFSYSGTFSRPAILTQTGGKFVRHPIPQDVWEMATNSAGGADKLTVKVTLARSGVAYGPLTQTWVIASGRLNGIIYYNSYGTQLAKNDTGAVGGDHKFGGAVLSIHVGDQGPALVAGGNGDSSACRVCHSVAANGSRLVAQQGNSYNTTADYDITAGNITESTLVHDLQFAGIYPDGTKALTRDGTLVPLPSDTTPIADSTANGLAASTGTNLGAPAFSPSGDLLAVNAMNSTTITDSAQKLLVMSFDATTSKFGAPVVVADYSADSNLEHRPAWPSFLPDSKSVVYHRQVKAGTDGNTDGATYTRKGAHGQIEWTSTTDAAHVTTLNQLNGSDSNGVSYLPQLATASTLACTADGTNVGGIDNAHADDTHLNYEPTVNPVASGGYAWIVFTSRRMYGNEATIPPFCSDPRGVDLTQNITTKKLWVSAIDLSAPPGTDVSHPAFYLPAQELLAGNARAYWVQDPCKADGNSCETGDQCCNGYCEPNGANGALVCSNTPPNSQCSMPQEKCAVVADCCDSSNLCVNGFCSVSSPPIL
ncbi:MAG: hypothetical protein ABI321_23235 [Polyangia bacterium]